MNLIFNFFKAYSFSILILVGIFCLCTMQVSDLPKVPTFKGLDKIVHVFMYISLAISLFLENKQTNKYSRYFFVLLFPVLYGAIIELVQHYFFPPRTAEWSDFFADFFGVLIGYFIAKRLAKTTIIKSIFKH